jgi:streptogramin lyase
VLLVLCAVVVAAGVLLNAQTSSSALTGIVRSQEEGAMEGVLVTAKRTGGTIAVTVVTDASGRYTFPRERLAPGTYSLRIRAIGYDLEGPASVSVTAQRATEADLRLRKTPDLASQMSNGEWFMSWPASDDMKNGLLNCTQCHSLQPVVRSKHTAAQFADVLNRMGRYSQGSTLTRPQLRPNVHGGGFANPIRDDMSAGREGERPVAQSRAGATAEFLASINLSSTDHWRYPLKTLPRPSGMGTRVIVTEYDLPRPETLPHDAAADSKGMVWYADFGSHILGVLDPATGKVTEYPIPVTKPGAPVGSLDLVFDKEENIWLGTMYQGSLARFDRASRTFRTWGSPTFKDRDEARIAMVMPSQVHLDGQVWIGGDSEYQVDVKTGEWKAIDYSVGMPPGSPTIRLLSSYGVSADSKNNFYGMNLNGTYIIKVDAKTKKVTPFATPTPNSGPRRGHMDAQDRLWFAEFRGNRIAMFDTRTETFKEWAVQSPWTSVYDAILDNAGFAWAGGMNNDRVVRLNTATGEMVEYLLPNPTNIRRVNVDNSQKRPAFWVGNNLGATLVKVEALD